MMMAPPLTQEQESADRLPLNVRLSRKRVKGFGSPWFPAMTTGDHSELQEFKARDLTDEELKRDQEMVPITQPRTPFPAYRWRLGYLVNRQVKFRGVFWHHFL